LSILFEPRKCGLRWAIYQEQCCTPTILPFSQMGSMASASRLQKQKANAGVEELDPEPPTHFWHNAKS
jgi:hypothetical protein